MKRVKVIISGRVQGIFFRAFVQERAISRQVKGYVMNRDDGKVEAVFEGSAEAVNEIVELCKKGPSGAIIDDFDVEEQEYLKEFKEFSIKR